MSKTDVSYFIKKKNGAYCFDCLRERRYSLILEGELCLAIRNNNSIIIKDQHFHWMCVPDTTLKEVLKVTTKQTILDDTKLNEECRKRIIRVLDNEKIEETQYDDGDFIIHHQKTLRYVNSLRDALKTKYGRKLEKKPDDNIDHDLTQDIKKLDLSK